MIGDSAAQAGMRLASDTSNLVSGAILQHLRNGAATRPALISDGVTWTYEQLARAVAAVTRELSGCVTPGDRVALLLPDSPAFAAAFFGVIGAGGIAAPVNPSLAPQDASAILRRLRPAVAIVDAGVVAGLEPLLAELRCAVLVRTNRLEPNAGADWESVALHGSGSDAAYCLHSSGTTGAPKAVIHDHVAVRACLAAFAAGSVAISPSDVIFAVPKLTFGYGLIGNLLFGLLSGATCVLAREPYELDRFLAHVQRDRPTMVLMQPRVIAQVLERGVPAEQFASVVVCYSAGEVLTPTLYRRWSERYDVPLLDAVGSTELGHVFIANAPGAVRPGSAGRVLPGFEVRIVDDEGRAAADGQHGELLARGVGMTRCYWDDPERTEALKRDGWVRTGDVFSRDADGYCTMFGRVDDLIKVGCGQWIFPADVEHVIASDAEVLECAVTGEADDDGIVHLCAFIVPRGEAAADDVAARVRASLRDRWPGEPHKHIDEVRFLAALPRTVNGKIRRADLRSGR